MTKEITKSIIIQEIQDKLKLREFEPEAFTFSERVAPVYNIEPHLEHWRTTFTTQSVTGTGAVDFFKVPATEKWSIRRYDVVFMTGVFTLAGVYTRRDNAPSAAYSCYLDLAAAQSVSYHVDLINPIILSPNDNIKVNVDGFTSVGDLRLYLDYMLEEIR